MLRVGLLVYFVCVLGFTSDSDSGDWFACTGCIVLFNLITLAERIDTVSTLCFMLGALVWGVSLQPAILNRCHLTLWLLIFSAFRNMIAIEAHATAAWRFSTMAEAYRIFVW